MLKFMFKNSRKKRLEERTAEIEMALTRLSNLVTSDNLSTRTYTLDELTFIACMTNNIDLGQQALDELRKVHARKEIALVVLFASKLSEVGVKAIDILDLPELEHLAFQTFEWAMFGFSPTGGIDLSAMGRHLTIPGNSFIDFSNANGSSTYCYAEGCLYNIYKYVKNRFGRYAPITLKILGYDRKLHEPQFSGLSYKDLGPWPRWGGQAGLRIIDPTFPWSDQIPPSGSI